MGEKTYVFWHFNYPQYIASRGTEQGTARGGDFIYTDTGPAALNKYNRNRHTILAVIIDDREKSFNGKEHYRVILCFYITREIIVLLIISITPTSLQSNSRYSQRRPNRPTLTSPLTTQYQGSSTHLPEQQLSAPPVQININTIWSWGRVRCRYCRYCRYGDTSR